MSDPQALILVRDAAAADAQIIAEFNVRLAEETEQLRLDSPTVRRGVDRVLGDRSRGRYFVAEARAADRAPVTDSDAVQALAAGARVVGCTMVTYEFSDWRDANLWWIQSVYVRADWRRRGVFRALYRYVRGQALAAGAGGLRLYVERENRAAQETYQSLGMVISPYLVMAEMFSREEGAASLE